MVSSQHIISLETNLAHHLPPNHAELIHHDYGRRSQPPKLLQEDRIIPVRLRTTVAAPAQPEGTVRRRCPELHLERSRARGRYKYCSILNGLRIYSSPRALVRGTRFSLT